MRDGRACAGDAVRLVIDLQGAQGSNRGRGIGRYCRELALAMTRQAGSHEVFVALNGSLPIQPLSEAFAAILPRKNMCIWYGPGATAEAMSHDPTRRRAAEAIRAEFLHALQPDLLHVGSVFEGWTDDVVTGWPAWLPRPPVVATGYDLIPLIRRTDYLDGAWKRDGLARWYLRCLQELRLSDAILTISRSSRDEMIEYLGSDPGYVFNIRAGIGAEFKPSQFTAAERDDLQQRLGLRANFILFLGGGDIRKNEAGLVRAYGLLPQHLRARHQLVIVGKCDEEALRSTARQARMDLSELVLIPFANEADLPALYATCALFVLPSLHEGFGLPAAEAMACGAPVIASNTTSLPEVIGRADALFDPFDPAAIAERIQAVLNNPAFRQELVSHAVRRAATFTWADSAARAWDGLEATHARLRQRTLSTSVSGWRLRLAYVSPVPPDQTGIANYSAELIPELARHYDITIVANIPATNNENLEPNFPMITPEQFLAEADGFERVIYQIGNSHFHGWQLDALLPHVPGTVTLHDSYLSGVRNWLARSTGRGPEGFTEDLYRSHGWPAVLREKRDGLHAAIRDFPCSLRVLQEAIGVIQHSRHGGDILAMHYGRDAIRSIHIIPHLRQRFVGPERHEARAKLGIPENQFVVCSFGYVSPHKLPARLIAAWHDAGLAVNARLVFVGQADDAGKLMLKAAAVGLGQQVEQLWTDYVDIGTYRTWLAAADVAVQLRADSHGETSGAIPDCMSAGLATVINDYGSAAEIPADTVVRLPADFTDAMLGEVLVQLRDPTRRQALATKARQYVADSLSPRRIAAEYYAAIEAAYGNGCAATRYRMTRSVAYALPPDGGDSGALAGFARAIVRTCPMPQPWSLLIDASGYRSLQQSEQLDALIIALLSTHRADIRVDLVEIHQGRWHFARTKAATLLGLPSAPAPDESVNFVMGTVLACIVPPDGWYEAELDQMRGLQDSGISIAVVFTSAPSATARAEICRLAEHVFSINPSDTAAINAWLACHFPGFGKSAMAVGSAAALLEALTAQDHQEART
jgi:glycosyltransferase involved in cell wall biosynthesis